MCVSVVDYKGRGWRRGVEGERRGGRGTEGGREIGRERGRQRDRDRDKTLLRTEAPDHVLSFPIFATATPTLSSPCHFCH